MDRLGRLDSFNRLGPQCVLLRRRRLPPALGRHLEAVGSARRAGSRGLRRSHRHIRLPADAKRLFLSGWAHKKHGGLDLRLPRRLGFRRGLQPGQHGFSGGLCIERRPGRSLGGAHGGAGLLGQHFAEAGRLGIARGHARSRLRGPAARNVQRLLRRRRPSRGSVFAALVRGKALVHFLLP